MKKVKEERANILCTSKWMMKHMKELCEIEGLGLTCSAENLGYDVRVIDWKSQKKRQARQSKES